ACTCAYVPTRATLVDGAHGTLYGGAVHTLTRQIGDISFVWRRGSEIKVLNLFSVGSGDPIHPILTDCFSAIMQKKGFWKRSEAPFASMCNVCRWTKDDSQALAI